MDRSWNDIVSSLTVTPGCKITVYEHNNAQGASKTFTQTSRWVGGSWNDKISSYYCTCDKDCATVFEHWKYGGIQQSIPQLLSNNLDNQWNDFISSLTVKSGCSLTVYEHHNRRGRSQKFQAGNTFFVGGTWNDKISSTSCSCTEASSSSCKCGVPQKDRQRIVGGQAATKNQYPWQVALVPTGYRPLITILWRNSHQLQHCPDCCSLQDKCFSVQGCCWGA